MAGTKVQAGQIWRAKDGVLITVIAVANDTVVEESGLFDEQPLVVVYINSVTAKIGALSMPDFCDRFEPVVFNNAQGGADA